MTVSVGSMPLQKTALGQPAVSRMVALALLPGIFITLLFVAIAALVAPYGIPPAMALLLTWPIGGLPLLIGILLYQGWKHNGRLSLSGVVLYRERLPWRQYVWLVLILLVWTALISTLLFPAGEGWRRAFFSWIPDWLVVSTFSQNLNQYTRPVLWGMVLLSFVMNIAVPIVEELYFRGYLLPRMARWGNWAPLINVVLFSLYHFWLPWETLNRIITLLPIVFVVQWKRNIYLSILVHCLLNTIGSIGLLALVLSLTP